MWLRQLVHKRVVVVFPAKRVAYFGDLFPSKLHL
jgi:hypothetical protein